MCGNHCYGGHCESWGVYRAFGILAEKHNYLWLAAYSIPKVTIVKKSDKINTGCGCKKRNEFSKSNRLNGLDSSEWQTRILVADSN